MKRNFKRNMLCAAVLLTVLQGCSMVNAQINERPVPDKVYDEYLYYDNDGSKNVSIQGSIEGKTQNYYFNQGATIDASNGGLHATILSHNWGKYNNSTYDIFNIGKDKEFKILQYSGYVNLEAQEGANLVINGGNIILESGVNNATTDNTNAAIHVETSGNVKIDSNSLYIGNKRIEDNKCNVGGISLVGAEYGKIADSVIDIKLNDSFIADNVDFGMALETFEDNRNSISIDVQNDIYINAFKNTTYDELKGYRGAGIYNLSYKNDKGYADVNLKSENGNITVKAQGYAYYGYGNTKADFIAKNGDVSLVSTEKYGIYACNDFDNKNNIINIEGKSVNISGNKYGASLENAHANIKADVLFLNGNGESLTLYLMKDATFNVNSNDVYINSDNTSCYMKGSSALDIKAKNTNIIADSYALYMKEGSTANINSDNINLVSKKYALSLNSASQADLTGSTVNISAKDNWAMTMYDKSKANITADTTLIDGFMYVSDSNTNIKSDQSVVQGIVKAVEGSTIDFASKEGTNTGLTAIYSDGYDAVIGEAEDGKVSTVNFKQSAVINAYEKVNGEYVTEYTNTPDKSAGRAIFAKRNSVINMSDAANAYGIYGDVVAGRGYDDSSVGGKVNIGGTGTVICGDVLAANTGTINVDINKGFIEGRIDSYEDMDTVEHSSRPGQIDEVPLKEAGNIKVSLNNSTWKARYQSWVSDLNLKDSVVDLTSDEGSSITMKKLSGNGTFNMKLNSEDHSKGNMLYIGDGSGKHTVNIVGGITGGYENISKENPLRFATVKNSGGEFVVADTEFGAITKGAGIYDLVYSVEKIDYDKNDADNEEYNGNGHKPKDEFVDNVLDADNTAENWVITGVQEKITSNAGEAVIDMSRSNYKNAVYLDRLNKRLGEARFIDGDEGMWVRMRHDRIGMEDAFRSSNTMYQLGYDKLHKEYENGERHIGAAIDYLDGETSYSKVGGTGETSRLGFWMYDTWLGNKGHYADYVAKFGHMSNDFDIKSLVTGESITGEYDNNLFSVSAEFGRKKDIGNDWYVEPQVQLQLARITDAAYATTQGTNVYVDAINSLIARAGFRLGKDVEKDSTIYFKADVMHEFLGDQRIVAGDNTGNMDKTFGNKGTWYDIGFGFSKVVGHNSYAYIDVEKSFGNDNDDTYQINGGVQWSF